MTKEPEEAHYMAWSDLSYSFERIKSELEDLC